MINLKTSGGSPKFPRDVYVLRITQEPEYQISKRSKNPMLVFNAECVRPEVKVIDGQEVELAGWEFTLYCTLEGDGIFVLGRLHGQLGFPLEFESDPETGLPLDLRYTGKEFAAICEGTEEVALDENKQPMVNPMNGKPIKRIQRKIVEVLEP